jgi:cytochrome c peroxidase
LVGNDVAPGWMDLGTTTYPTWTEASYWDPAAVLPVFKVTCRSTAPPHPYLGRSIYTTDPGRALATGKCADVGSIVMQQLRGLAARAPHFANGGARDLRELVDYYDRRFDMKLAESEKQDLVNFLRVL